MLLDLLSLFEPQAPGVVHPYAPFTKAPVSVGDAPSVSLTVDSSTDSSVINSMTGSKVTNG